MTKEESRILVLEPTHMENLDLEGTDPSYIPTPIPVLQFQILDPTVIQTCHTEKRNTVHAECNATLTKSNVNILKESIQGKL